MIFFGPPCITELLICLLVLKANTTKNNVPYTPVELDKSREQNSRVLKICTIVRNTQQLQYNILKRSAGWRRAEGKVAIKR